MKNILLLLTFSVLGMACQEVSYVDSKLLNVTNSCTPRSGTFGVTYYPENGDTCNLAGEHELKFTKENLPNNFKVSDDLCTFSAELKDNDEVQYISVEFNEHWSEGSGSVHVVSSSCNSQYNITIVKL